MDLSLSMLILMMHWQIFIRKKLSIMIHLLSYNKVIADLKTTCAAMHKCIKKYKTNE